MSQFDSLFATFAAPVLTENMGESVTYTPATGTASTIRAIIIREQAQAVGSMGDVAYRYSVTAWVRKADIATLTVRKDTIAYKVNSWDASTVTRVIEECIQQTADMYFVRLQ